MTEASGRIVDKGSERLCSDLLTLFVPDGSLRDLYIRNTGIDDWNTLVRGLATLGVLVKISQPFQSVENFDAEIIFEHTTSTPPLLMKVFLSEALVANCHFFTTEEIEFDLDPKQVSSKEDVAIILAFMRTIGEILSKDVILTEENSQSHRIATFNPASGEFLIQ